MVYNEFINNNKGGKTMKKNRKNQFGIGLLELMLALAIIAVLLVMATRYYMGASASSRISQVIDSVTGLAAAGENWQQKNHGSYNGLCEGTSTATTTTLTKCVTDGWLPASLVADDTNIVTPWGDGAVTVTAVEITVTFPTTIPTQENKNLTTKLCSGKGADGKAITTVTKYNVVAQTCEGAA
jgi:Tfp pilus assembly protein PilE